MIDKKLMKEVPEVKVHIAKNVCYQVIALILNCLIIVTLGNAIKLLIENNLTIAIVLKSILLISLAIIGRLLCTYYAGKESHLAAKTVKGKLRTRIYKKVLKLGKEYTKAMSTAELLQISVEGVMQLESYFANYLPQLFYAMIAPVILFVIVGTIHFRIALILFCCVPLIPCSIITVQKIAKKLLNKYWGEYTTLGDSFLENIEGLTTLKIYSADAYKHEQMNESAERFRKITMKVLTMQLNSIAVMDIMAYGGCAVGIISSVYAYQNHEIMMYHAIIIILLCAEFFLPMRLLGSFFHIAMNGVAASNKMFTLLELENSGERTNFLKEIDITLNNMCFSYEDGEEVLHNITLDIPANTMVSIVGQSGCGKSTIARIIAGVNKGYAGSVAIGGKEVCTIHEESLYEHITVLGVGSYLFKGSVKENLLMGNASATDDELWSALEQVRLKEFVDTKQGLDTIIMEKGSNLSGGQCQRLALARALLHNSEIYIFDEATSNIDSESENEIMEVLKDMRKTKTILLISHRLANVVESDAIYVLEQGGVCEYGTHHELLAKNGMYRKLWKTQRELECSLGGAYEESK